MRYRMKNMRYIAALTAWFRYGTPPLRANERVARRTACFNLGIRYAALGWRKRVAAFNNQEEKRRKNAKGGKDICGEGVRVGEGACM